MNLYVLNKTGKKIFVRVIGKPSSAPGALYDVTLELHSKIPRKTKETIKIMQIDNEDSDWMDERNPNEPVQLANHLGWDIDYNEYKVGGDFAVELVARNGSSKN